MMRAAFSNFLTSYARGQQSWLITVFVGLLGLGAILRLMLNQIDIMPFGLVLLALILGLFITMWQITGGVRNGLKQLGQSSGLFICILLFGLSLFTLVMNGSALVSVLSKQSPKPIAQSQPSGFEIEVLNEGKSIHVSGEITYAMMDALEQELNGLVEQLTLESIGGNVFAARILAKKISQYEIETRVESYCYSACTLVFMGGAKRAIGQAGKLGFHGYSVDGGVAEPFIDISKEEKIDIALLDSFGVQMAFILRAFETPHNTLWIPDRAALEKAGVLVP